MTDSSGGCAERDQSHSWAKATNAVFCIGVRSTLNMEHAYTHRINIPSNVVEELGLGKEDYLLLKTKKAEWFDMLDWSQMKNTWDKLPEETKKKIREDGIFDESEHFQQQRKRR